jgi:hypothetical protein
MTSLKEAQKRLPLLRKKPTTGAPSRDGSHLLPTSREAGDAFYQCAVEIAKIAYTRIANRYPVQDRAKDPTVLKQWNEKMDDAKKILNEHRNLIFEAVLPLFQVRRRIGEEPTVEADNHAHDYFVNNVFDTMVRTYKAWADILVAPDDVDSFEKTVDKVAKIQRERLERLLLNYVFGFIDLSLPKEEK